MSEQAAATTPTTETKPSSFQAIMASVKATLAPEPETKPAPATETSTKPVEKEVKAEAKPETKAEKPKEDKPATEEAKEEPKRKRDSSGKFASDEVEDAAKADPSEDKTPASLRKAYEDAKAELAALKKAGAQSAVPTEEYEALRKEVDEYKDLIHKFKREEHPEFKSKYTKPLETKIAAAKRLTDAQFHARLEKVMRDPQSPERLDALDNLIADMPTAKQAEILRLAGDAADIAQARDEELANAREWVKTSEARTREQQRAEHARQQKAATELFESTAQEAAEEMEFFRMKEGDEAHNKMVKRRLAAARELFMGENTPERLAASSLLAIKGREAAHLLAQAQKEISRLQKENEEFRTNRPGVPTAGSPAKTKMTAMQAALDAIKNGPK